MHRPVRTCIGCRGQAAKRDLLRLVWNAGPSPDPEQVKPGRGAYLHHSKDCLELAIRRRSLARSLRLQGGGDTVDAARLRQVVEPHLEPSSSGPPADFA